MLIGESEVIINIGARGDDFVLFSFRHGRLTCRLKKASPRSGTRATRSDDDNFFHKDAQGSPQQDELQVLAERGNPMKDEGTQTR